jgi:hypothetical protein
LHPVTSSYDRVAITYLIGEIEPKKRRKSSKMIQQEENVIGKELVRDPLPVPDSIPTSTNIRSFYIPYSY